MGLPKSLVRNRAAARNICFSYREAFEHGVIARRLRAFSPRALIIAASALIALVALPLALTARARLERGDTTTLPFSLRAVDSDGHPVAGARVMSDEREVGITDSFGDWRSTVRVRSGETLTLNIVKALAGKMFAAVARIDVPRRGRPEAVKILVRLRPGKVATTTRDENNDVFIPVNGRQTAAKPGKKGADSPAGITVAGPNVVGDQSQAAIRLSAALKAVMLERGIGIDPKSPWQIEVRGLHTALKGSGLPLLVTFRGPARTIGLLLDRPIDEERAAAADLYTALGRFVPQNFEAHAEGESWYLSALERALWPPQEGDVVVDELGQSFTLTTEASEGGKARLRLRGQGRVPCSIESAALADHAPCRVATQTKMRGLPVAQLRLRGDLTRVRVFIDGVEAHRLVDDLFTFPVGGPTGVNVALVSGDSLVYRGHFAVPPPSRLGVYRPLTLRLAALVPKAPRALPRSLLKRQKTLVAQRQKAQSKSKRY